VVDRRDVDLIITRISQWAKSPSDPYDLDYDGHITVMDARIAVTLCTKPGCGL
jgi:hypothetical protein